MLKTIKEVLRTGNATTGYPFESLHQHEHYRGKPVHDVADCIACAACAIACPPNAIQMKIDVGKGLTTWSINFGRCIFCGRCEEVCPTKAIKLSKEFELAVFDKNDLEETASYPLQKCVECGAYFASQKEVDYAARILAQDADEDEIRQALALVRTCPDCKRKADAYRALDRIQATGDPTPEPSADAVAEARRIAEQRREGASR